MRLLKFTDMWLRSCLESELRNPLFKISFESFLSQLSREKIDKHFSLAYSRALNRPLRNWVPEYKTFMSPLTLRLTRFTAEAKKVRCAKKFDVCLDSFTSVQIAQHFHQIEFALFRKIHIGSELSTCAWSRDPQSAPHVNEMIAYFNRVAFWVATKIIGETQSKERIANIVRFIDIATECFQRNNFNTLMAISAGLNNCNILVLPEWKVRFECDTIDMKDVPKQRLECLKRLEELMSTKSNYLRYRNHLRAVMFETFSQTLKVPVLPYLGIFLRDLIFIQDGNPSNTGDKKNYQKIEMLGSVLTQVKKLQEQETTTLMEDEDPILTNLLCNLVTLNQV